jgi:hypothetical protein
MLPIVRVMKRMHGKNKSEFVCVALHSGLTSFLRNSIKGLLRNLEKRNIHELFQAKHVENPHKTCALALLTLRQRRQLLCLMRGLQALH